MSVSLAFVLGDHWWLVNSPHKWPAMWKVFYAMSSWGHRIFESSQSLSDTMAVFHSHLGSSPDEFSWGCRFTDGVQIVTDLQYNIDGLVQDCSISSALALEILQSCTKLLVCNRDVTIHQCITIYRYTAPTIRITRLKIVSWYVLPHIL